MAEFRWVAKSYCWAFYQFFQIFMFPIKNETKIFLDQKINGKKCIKLIATCTLTYLYFIILEIDMLNSCWTVFYDITMCPIILCDFFLSHWLKYFFVCIFLSLNWGWNFFSCYFVDN
jgi:hypothetical protein